MQTNYIVAMERVVISNTFVVEVDQCTAPVHTQVYGQEDQVKTKYVNLVYRTNECSVIHTHVYIHTVHVNLHVHVHAIGQVSVHIQYM